ncbi:MAG: AAA family ATPase [Prevotella sp.]|nr:AAA family ATPase [Prevotella sp.]
MKYADYIKEIEIDSLWHEGGTEGKGRSQGEKHIRWQLDPSVNILSGVNGDGKSTILRRTIMGVRRVSDVGGDGIRIATVPEDAEYVRYNWIATPDVRSEYDTNLLTLVERYETVMHDEVRQTLLFDIIDNLFSATHKTVDRSKKEFAMLFWGEPLDLTVLSSGEKQMLTILLAVYLENDEHYVLFMDEPEVSLHVEWQKVLISTILKLNPNVQIILSTHSPAMIMDGWMDKVTEVSEIAS